MPELPEVEHVRQNLIETVLGRRITAVRVARPNIVTGSCDGPSLLRRDAISSVLRHGKQLAFVGSSGRVLCVHLGMTGQLLVVSHRQRPHRLDHIHIVWRLGTRDGHPAGRLMFRDPRRFGGLWTFASVADLNEQRWSLLGPDALKITPSQFARRITGSRRSIKAALLDQFLLAGVGNIYADESLFRARIHPATPCGELEADRCRRLIRALRWILRRAIDGGGSTIRDYANAVGVPGSFQHSHQVYGRSGQLCRRCGAPLRSGQLAQRTTVWCEGCQRVHRATAAV